MLNRASIDGNKTPDKNQGGFTLIEMLIAIVISSFVCVAAMNSIPAIFKQTYRAYFQYQLDREVRQVLLNMEKDIRRIGYCSSAHCTGEPIKISAKFLSKINNSCIIFAYDQDLSGQWENIKSKKTETDYFSYRFNGEKLESNRNVRNCDGTRWQSLFDPNVVKVKRLSFNLLKNKRILEVFLAVETRLLPNQVFNYQFAVFLRNL
ncbi:prepilin peptidase-dependent protein [Providencia rettgeri]|uniref:prepilin peptidase-dependent protein n=1 Tax=Providencia TaxID=586 RepID=UPI001011ABF7|nr:MULTISPECIES: prepilin peptidase-dependent protein [Providencia]EJD6507959.1 prepilin peptidase-dependent protein [Providencia rettgeri]EJD6672896.1 prepilin peptidase-dependent protein [Providencia rettgeri]ELR5227625.1 prepilin peptidase-dependent protein [Providencia rettgeri]ELT5688836.1 prepilin peptidase-dependent protein [Providencia rettgeri]MBQ0313636.1 prepilin peptidase-dependent protein [Providencia rettgeri]